MLSRGFVVQKKYLQSKPCDKFSSILRAEIPLNFLENWEDRREVSRWMMTLQSNSQRKTTEDKPHFYYTYAILNSLSSFIH